MARGRVGVVFLGSSVSVNIHKFFIHGKGSAVLFVCIGFASHRTRSRLRCLVARVHSLRPNRYAQSLPAQRMQESDTFEMPIAPSQRPAAGGKFKQMRDMADTEIELGSVVLPAVDEGESAGRVKDASEHQNLRRWQAATAISCLMAIGLLAMMLLSQGTGVTFSLFPSRAGMPSGVTGTTSGPGWQPPRAYPASPPAPPAPPSQPPRLHPVTPPLLPPSPSMPVPQPVPLIVDTDMSFDVDDVGALCLAHALADRNEVTLLATVHDAGVPAGVGAISVINDYYGRSSVPLGAFKGRFGRRPYDPSHWVDGPYIHDLVARFPSRVQDSSQSPDAVQTYRRALAAAADRSVVIAAIGFTTNLAALLRSPPDEDSPLSGRALVAQKVRRVVYQGGWYPYGSETFNWECGGEWYYHEADDGCAGTSAEVVNGLTDLGVEQQFTDVGEEMYTGKPLAACAPASSPCRTAFVKWLGREGTGRPSWDEVAVLLAARGAERLTFGATSPLSLVHGTNVVNAAGANRWSANVSTGYNHSYLAVREGWGMQSVRAAVTMEIDQLMCQPPQLSRLPTYQAQFAEMNSPTPPPPPPRPPRIPGEEDQVFEEPTCDDCWGINGGDDGDCSSIRGCGSWLCSFCTNEDFD